MSKKIIYLTHCSARKNLSLRSINRRVTPDNLYTATPTQRFMKRCIMSRVNWAIFSDKYGIWFSHERNTWYEKNPDKVSPEEFEALVQNFNEKLKDFDEIRFYHNPGRFHKLYRRLVKHPLLNKKIKLFTHLEQIT
jgi:hypothetical protein